MTNLGNYIDEQDLNLPQVCFKTSHELGSYQCLRQRISFECQCPSKLALLPLHCHFSSNFRPNYVAIGLTLVKIIGKYVARVVNYAQKYL
jgi:hypothetical protein